MLVTTCTSCGAENREGARFCDACGSELSGRPLSAREQRKTVTVLFCDVTGSTALGETLDPESLRQILARYFETVREGVERHGGTVEKFIGDAVMAVFGVPLVHEDDALRCVRAAVDVHAALGPLNDELRRDYGTTVSVRMGVATGEVVTGTEERLATGDAVNVAARLEQQAEPGEILLGEATVQLLRGAVDVEELEPLVLKGKGKAVSASRLVSLREVDPARRLDVPIVGRERELRILRDAWGRVVTESSCHLFTVLGAAGVGKSRLVLELLDSLSGARVLQGRCLPYGEGITYWAVVEVLKQLPDASSLGLEGRALTAIRDVLGEGASPTSTDEIAWAVRKAIEACAATTPIVCVFDDVHWGEETFLDLVEHIADLSRGAPILLLCMARPELLDRRPGWAGGKLNATTVLLEPLSGDDSSQLIEELLGDKRIGRPIRDRIREAAEGNPLFVEEMVAMLEESPDGDVVVPPTIQALLAARIDQLDPAERGVLECGAVEGRIFHRGAVEALGPDESRVSARLTSLVRKELVRPERARIEGDDAFRFRHQLIRDATYDGLPKAVRAELHERFAGWVEERALELVERDEIIGYHLEQSHRYRLELGPLDNAARRVGERAGRHLAAAGRRGLDRGDSHAAITLLERAWSLRQESVDVDLGLALADALFAGGRPIDGVQLARQVADAAAESGDTIGEWTARLDEARLASSVGGVTGESLLQLVSAARPVLEEGGDERALAAAAMAETWSYNSLLQIARMREAATRVVALARAAGARRRELVGRTWQVLALFLGPTPVADALREIESEHGDEMLVPHVQMVRAILLAMLGRFDEGRALITAEREHFADLGSVVGEALATSNLGKIERLAGNPDTAARCLQEACLAFDAMGEQSYLSTYIGEFGQALFELGRLDEAQQCSVRGEALGASDDVITQMLWRQVRAKVLVRSGEIAEAEQLAREAVAIGGPTDALEARADAHRDLAYVVELAGRHDEAGAELERALKLYREKELSVMVSRIGEQLTRVRAGSTAR